MVLEKTMGKLFILCEWIMRLAYVNLLWFLFTVAGLLVFGFFPATVALFTIIRKWMMKEWEVPIWRTFREVYGSEFKRANGLGAILVLVGACIILDAVYLFSMGGTLSLAVAVPLLIVACLYLVTLLYFFPVYVHYELKWKDYLKHAFLLGVYHIHMSILMVGSIAAIVVVLLYQPGLIPFFGVVSLAWIMMFGGMHSFHRIEVRMNKRNGVKVIMR